jgi:hypothetical protein
MTLLLIDRNPQLSLRPPITRSVGAKHTPGKVKRLKQTLKRWLAEHHEVTALFDLQHQLATFHSTYSALPKAHPGNNITNEYFRLRNDIIDKIGKLSLGHTGTPIRMLIHGTKIRIITTEGEFINELSLDTENHYQKQ